jgi:hypothetical protein
MIGCLHQGLAPKIIMMLFGQQKQIVYAARLGAYVYDDFALSAKLG